MASGSFAAAAAAAADDDDKSLQSCPTLCDPIDSSPPGSPVPGILQARTLERVAISFSNAWKVKLLSHSWQRDGETVETVRDFILGAPKPLQMVTAAMKLKDACSLEENLQST